MIKVCEPSLLPIASRWGGGAAPRGAQVGDGGVTSSAASDPSVIFAEEARCHLPIKDGEENTETTQNKAGAFFCQ